MRNYTRENKLKSEVFSKQWFTRQYYRKKDNAKRRDLVFSLTKDQFVELYSIPSCYYCLEKLDRFITIDRLKNELGYVPDNCVISCNKCNSMKGSLSEDVFRQLRPLFMEKHRIEQSIKAIMKPTISSGRFSV